MATFKRGCVGGRIFSDTGFSIGIGDRSHMIYRNRRRSRIRTGANTSRRPAVPAKTGPFSATCATGGRHPGLGRKT